MTDILDETDTNNNKTIDSLLNSSNASFPMDGYGRVYHLQVKAGDVERRILSVGSYGRAKALSNFLDNKKEEITSNRGFSVFSGSFNGVKMSIVATGMGIAMVDFVVRECSAVVAQKMAILRFGTCGAIQKDTKLGQFVVADSSVLIRRNPDAFVDDTVALYDVSKPIAADRTLLHIVKKCIAEDAGADAFVVGLNATADSFYSSQGRPDPNFVDKNASLIDDVASTYPSFSSLEMETGHLYHLAQSSRNNKVVACAAAIALAQRHTNEFLDKVSLHDRELVGGKAMLHALSVYKFDDE